LVYFYQEKMESFSYMCLFGQLTIQVITLSGGDDFS
jgi:hypothetical protein